MSEIDAYQLGSPSEILNAAETHGRVVLEFDDPDEARGMAYRLHNQLRRDRHNPAMGGGADSLAVYKKGSTVTVIDYYHESNRGRVQVTVGATENGSET